MIDQATTFQPDVSVVMAVRDAGAHLAEAIESILRQTFHNFEFVIIDDGSTDDTPEIIRRFVGVDERVRPIRCEQGGLPRALNVGIAATRSPLIARMDGDDVSLPERLERQLAYLESHRECVAVGTSVKLIDSDGDPIGYDRAASGHDEIITAVIKSRRSAMAHPSVMIRRTALEQVGGYDERYAAAQDLDLFLRLAECGRLANLPDYLIELRKHHRQVSASRREEQRKFAEEIVNGYCARNGIAMPTDLRRQSNDRQDSQLRFHGDLATCAMRNGNQQTALKHLRRALATSPASVYAWMTALRVSRDYLRCLFGAIGPASARQVQQ